MTRSVAKSFPTFDCDAHVTELPDIWDRIPAADRELVKQSYWPEGHQIIVNGEHATRAIWDQSNHVINSGECAGPGASKKILRKLRSMPRTEALARQFYFPGARDPHARVQDLDLLGIDQVVVIPIMMFNHYPWVKNIHAAAIVARAYNDWIQEWCSTYPDRLFPAACLPLQSPELAAHEVRRAAKRGFPLAMIRPTDQLGNYPNQAKFDPLWDTLTDTGMAVAIHSLASPKRVWPLAPAGHPQWSPGMILEEAINAQQMRALSQSMGFVFEAMTWLVNMLLSGFLERHRGFSLAIMESNASWLPMTLEECDRAYKLYYGERTAPLERMPSETFLERCFIAFEGDETPVYRQYRYFEDIAIWSSDVYHHDGSDAWSAIREMRRHRVPVGAQEKIMGANARRLYGIKPQTFTTTEPTSYSRPDWYPTSNQVDAEFAALSHRS
ncbi:MAG: hypothetical protein EXR49_05765 [Dehalococcoidia bacterium]|nr:hypothetical protein [Dehalococcoidia bacterium]